MAGYRKLGRTSSQRKALLRNQVTDLLCYGKIKTTEAKAKDNFDEVTVQAKVVRKDANGKRVKEDGKVVFDTVEKTIKKDRPSRLHARKQMAKVLYTRKDIPAAVAKRKANTKEINLQDKLFGELAEKYATRNGGYTRIVKIGERKGDAAMEVIIELV